MSVTKDVLFFFPRRFQQERYEAEIKKLNKEKEPRDISRLTKSYSVIVSYPKQFVPVLKPKKSCYSSINVGEFSLEKSSDCDRLDEKAPQIQKSKKLVHME